MLNSEFVEICWIQNSPKMWISHNCELHTNLKSTFVHLSEVSTYRFTILNEEVVTTRFFTAPGLDMNGMDRKWLNLCWIGFMIWRVRIFHSSRGNGCLQHWQRCGFTFEPSDRDLVQVWFCTFPVRMTRTRLGRTKSHFGYWNLNKHVLKRGCFQVCVGIYVLCWKTGIAIVVEVKLFSSALFWPCGIDWGDGKVRSTSLSRRFDKGQNLNMRLAIDPCFVSNRIRARMRYI